MTGEQAAKYFIIEVDEAAPIAVNAKSEYFMSYKHVPESITNKDSEGSNATILKSLSEITTRLAKLEAPPIEEPRLKPNEKIEQLKKEASLRNAKSKAYSYLKNK